MTDTSRPVRRVTLTSVRVTGGGSARPLTIELHPTYVVVRPKGTRQRLTATYDQIWNVAARNAAEATRRERLEAAKARKLAKGGR